MSYLAAASLADITARPERISAHYDLARSTFISNLGAGFSAQCEDHLKLAWCAVVAFDLKPYGPSTVHDLPGLMAAPALDCDNYVSLAWRLFKLMRPINSTSIAALGWDGGAVGNHAQMQAQTAGSPDILLDPTIGLVVNGCSLDGLVGDFVYPTNCVASFFSFNPRPSIAVFEATVRDAVVNTKYKPSDMIYFIRDPAKLATLPPRENWLTPRA